MGNVKKILSVMLSCAIAFSSAVAAIPVSTAALRTEDPSVVYDNTNVTESKEEEIPFNVFDIYDAFYGITKPTTTTSTTTASTTTTTATKATTKATTTSTAATTQRPVVTTTAATAMPPKYTSGTGQALTTTKPLLAVATTTKPVASATTAATSKTTAKPTSATTTKATTKPVTTTTAQQSVTTTKTVQVTTTKPQVLPVPDTTASSKSTSTTSAAQTETTTSAETNVVTRPGSLGEFYLNGIDVSEHQALIDWEKVEQSGIDFAIIRAGYGKEAYQRDRYFDINMQNIQKTNIHYGVYWFSYAMTVEDALKEAQVCCDIIKDYDGYTFPIYFDIELNSQRDYLTTAQVSAITETFCSYLEEQGYYTGIYSCASFLTTKIYSNVLEKYDVWVAQYNSKLDLYYGDYGIWQYSSVGQVDGISTAVDMNYCYLNYPLLVSPETYTGIVTTYPQTMTTTTTTTAADGSTTTAVNGSTTTAAPVTTTAPKTTATPNTTTSTTTTAPVTTTTTTTKPAAQFDPYSYSSVGISVSGDNGYINWNSVKKAGYGFGVIRAGGGPDITGADPLFYVNMENAIAAGVDRGVYWEIKSTTEEDMLREAEAFHKVIRDYSYEYPIYLDLTNPAIADAGLSQAELTKLISAFCSYFEDMRYYIGIRADEDFLCNSLDPELFKAYDVYLVNSGDTPVFSSKYGVWQFGTDEIDGVLGDTDVAYCYRVYPAVMSFYGLNQKS